MRVGGFPKSIFPHVLTCRLQDAEDRTIAVAIHQAVAASVRLELLPKSTIDVFITVIESDGIEGCVAIGSIAASTALADAGIEMFGIVISCAAVRLRSRRVSISLSTCTVYPGWRHLAGSQRRGSAPIERIFGTSMYASSRDFDKCLAVWPDASSRSHHSKRACIPDLRELSDPSSRLWTRVKSAASTFIPLLPKPYCASDKSRLKGPSELSFFYNSVPGVAAF